VTGRPPRPLLLLAAVSALVACAPLAYLVVRTLDAGLADVVDALWRERTAELAVRSLALALSVAAACMVIGIPTGWLIARARLPLRPLWVVLAALPLALPSYVAAFAWISTLEGFSGFFAAWVVLTSVSTPYVVLPVAAVLRATDPALEEVARSLGRSPLRAMTTASLPLALPAAAAGGLLVALYVLSDFGAVAVLRVDVFTRAIFASYRASFDRTSAAVLALVLVALAALLVMWEQRARSRAATWRVGGGSRREAPLVELGRWTPLAVAWLAGSAVIALGVPTYGLLTRLLEGRRLGVDTAELAAATASTIAVAGAGALLATALALPVGILTARYRTRSTRIVEGGAYIGHALPGVVVGLSLVFLTLTLVPGIYQTVLTLALAYTVLFLPNAIGAIRASTAQVPPALEQVARSLGRRPVRAWSDVTARIAWPGVLAGGLLVLLTAMKELPATLMLRPTGLDTLATELWSRTEVAAYSAAAPYAAALVLLAALPAFWVSRTLGGDAPQEQA
jgi:iron(III) transport system permease protein